MIRRLMFFGALGVGALVLGGCFARVHTRPAVATYSTGHAQSGVVVYQAPPQPQVTVATPPAAPYAGAVWVQGHWQWNGAQYVWVQGHYIQPRAGYVYAQPQWQRRGNGYVYVQGRWRQGRARRHHRQAPRGRVIVQQPAQRGTVQQGRGSVQVQGRGSVQVR